MTPRTPYQKGKLYAFDGKAFVELEPSDERKLPVTEEAVNAVKAVRKAAVLPQKRLPVAKRV